MKKAVAWALVAALVMQLTLLASVPHVFDAGMAALLTAMTPARTPTASSPASAGPGSRPMSRSDSFDAQFGQQRVNGRRLPKA